MAFIPRLFPACDLHLLVGTTIPLHLFTNVGAAWDEISGPTISQFLPDPGSGTAVSFAAQALTGVSTGEVFGRFRVTFGAATLTHAIHATVHGQLLRLFTAHASIEMEAGRKDRQLVVFAEFETSAVKSTHDITGHPYLAYAVSGLAGVTVDADGFVEVGATTGTATITITQRGVTGGPSTTVSLTVVAAPTTRDTLARVFKGGATRTVSILLLAEGFTTAEKRKFDVLAQHIANRLTASTSPYNLLRESLEIFSAFEPSRESGVSIGPRVCPVPGDPTWIQPVVIARRRAGNNNLMLHEVVHHLGYPPASPPTYVAARAQLAGRGNLDQPRYDAWLLLRDLRYTRPRDTAFGLVVGQRTHAAPTTEILPGRTAATDLLFEREAYRTVTVDDRRIASLAKRGTGPEQTFIDVQDRFVRTLRIPGDPVPYGNRWVAGASAFGLVVYVVNTDASQGVRDIGYTMVSNGGGAAMFPAVASTIVPGLFEVAPVAAITPAHQRHGMYRASADEIASVVAHELAHTEAFGNLHDEYVGAELKYRSPPPTTEHASINTRTNVQLIGAARAPGDPAMRADLLKWNWERVEAAAEVTGLTPLAAAVEIVVEDIARWPAASVGRNAFLRTFDLATKGRAPSPDLAIQHVDVATRTIRVAVPAPFTPATLIAAFPTGSRLVIPLRNATGVRRIVDPRMIAAMTGGPFGASLTGCQVNPDQRPAQVAGFPYPRNHSDTPAAYESGANRHCGVIRGVGECVMRNGYVVYYDPTTGAPAADPTGSKPTGFCFVCKYTIVDKINAALHGALDREYPR